MAGPTGSALASFRRDLGALSADRRSALMAKTFVASLADLFSSAARAGFSGSDFATLRRQAEESLAAASGVVAILYSTWIQFCLIAEARYWSKATFTSRNDVDRVRSVMSAAFDRAIEDAADAQLTTVLRTLTTLSAALQRHLIATARPLPRMIRYATARPLPSLVLAHRLYQDASRRDELEAENNVANPLFMPTSGQALSA
ncbi:hypothetical protein [Kaistia sp. 32K]|uniref:hypothetical protein n=1 Tax=Kaistia sp. 32K TaxID=2795690 RepID=UPI001914F922|nr:hypothetical protein [Kaistia sp. 32K]